MQDYKNINEDIRKKIAKIREIKNARKAKKLEDSLILSLSYLVHSVVYKYKWFDNYDDLYQEGMLGLINAVRKYNTDMSFHFTRYAMWWIKARVGRSIKKLSLISINNDEKMQCYIRYDIREDDIIEGNDPEKELFLTENIDDLYNAINDLPEKHQQVLEMRFGLNNGKKYGLQEMTDKLNMTREGIRQLEHRIINNLKNNITFNE